MVRRLVKFTCFQGRARAEEKEKLEFQCANLQAGSKREKREKCFFFFMLSSYN